MMSHYMMEGGAERGRAGQSGAEDAGQKTENICITKRDRNYSWVVNHGNPEKMFPSNVLIY